MNPITRISQGATAADHWPQVLVIVPTIDECGNIGTLLPAILRVHSRISVLVVDDGSTDGTPDLVRALASRSGRVHLLERSGPVGLGPAYLEGFRWALANSECELVIEMDGDWSHHPRFLPALVRKAVLEADVVVGSRYLDGIAVVNWSLRRLALSRFAARYAGLATGLPLTDPTSGFKAIRRAVLEALDLRKIRSSGYTFQIELPFRARQLGFRLAEVPIVFTDRKSGQSKLNAWIGIEAAWRCWWLSISRPFAPSTSSTRPGPPSALEPSGADQQAAHGNRRVSR